MIRQALTPSTCTRDQHYIVRDAVVIVDESTGRTMPDRTWRDGMHQAVEAKERLEVRALKRTVARISFQRFFRMYPHLAGMSSHRSNRAASLCGSTVRRWSRCRPPAFAPAW